MRLSGRGGPPNMTDDFVEYMTSNAFLIQAEADKIIAILLTTAVLAIAIARARHLLVRSVSEGAAARDLSRFFDPGVAARIRSAAMSIKAGEGELRDVAILTVDLRGFTRLSTELAPDDVMKLLQDYQGRVCPLIVEQRRQHRQVPGRRHPGLVRRGGALDDRRGRRPARGRCGDRGGRSLGRRTPGGRPAAARRSDWPWRQGRVVFGAVGDGERLEFTVIGDAVNFAAKLGKHNKDEKTRALVDGSTYALAERQGYVPPAVRASAGRGRTVGGVGRFGRYCGPGQ